MSPEPPAAAFVASCGDAAIHAPVDQGGWGVNRGSSPHHPGGVCLHPIARGSRSISRPCSTRRSPPAGPQEAEKHLRFAIELYERAQQAAEVAVTYRALGDPIAERGSLQEAADAYRTGILALEPRL
jgi:hypothetical protein